MKKPTRHHAARKEPAATLTPQQLIAIERERRAAICGAEVRAVLKKHNCQLQARTTIVDDQIHNAVAVIALDTPEPPPA